MTLSSRRALVWLTAVVLLGLNDHVLKYAGVLPPIVTGKLSDFAGLIVAPAFLVHLARLVAPEVSHRFERGIRLAALLLIAVPFSVINLIPAASHELVLAMSRIGMSWMLWPDPTDLVSLTVLPLSYWVCKFDAPPQRSVFEGALLLASATLCVATGAVPMDSSRGFLINLTMQPVNVRTARLDGEMDCSLDTPLLESGVLRSEDFITGGTAVLAPGEMVKLTGVDESSCLPVRLMVWATEQEEDAASVVVGFGHRSREMADPYRAKDLEDRTNLAEIVGSGDDLEIRLGPGLSALELAEGPSPIPPVECAFPSYTTLSTSSDSIEVTAVEQISERCTAYRGHRPAVGSSGQGGSNGEGGANSGEGGMGASSASSSDELPETLTICTDEEISLGVGDVTSKWVTGNSELTGTLYQVLWDGKRRDIQPIEAQHSNSSLDEGTPCAQVRHECGAVFVRTPPSWNRSSATNQRFEAGWMTIVARYGCPRELLEPIRYDRWVSIHDSP